MKVCLKFSAGLCSIESDYHIINHTNQDLIIMGDSSSGTYLVPAASSSLVCSRLDNSGLRFQLKMLSCTASQQVFLSPSREQQVVTCQTGEGSQYHILATLCRDSVLVKQVRL